MSSIFGTSLRGMGATSADPPTAVVAPAPMPVIDDGSEPTASDMAWRVGRTVGAAASVFHGYKRTRSIGWALVWGFFGALAPIITVPVAIAQGFGKPKGRS